jgi:CBS domain-containing protein
MIRIINNNMSLKDTEVLFHPSISQGTKLARVAELMVSEKVSEVFVSGKDNAAPIGVVRDLDIVACVADGKDLSKVVAEDAMLRPPPYVEEGATFREVAAVVAKTQVKRILVKRGRELVGTIEAGELFDLISNSLERIDVFKAVSVRARLRIAELLSIKPMSVDELSQELGIKPITVRHHIEVLRRTGVIEESQNDHLYGKVGRPLTLFKLTNSILRRHEL